MLNLVWLPVGFIFGVAIAVVLGRSSFVADLVSASEAKVNFGAVAALIALFASIVWVSWVVYKTNAVPDLSGISFFIGTMYGISKVKEVVAAAKGISSGSGSQSGEVRINLLVILAMVLSVILIAGCSLAPIIPSTTEKVSVQGTAVQEVAPIADLKTFDVPAGVDKKDVIVVFEQPQPDGKIATVTVTKEKDGIFSAPKYHFYRNAVAANPAPAVKSSHDIPSAPITPHVAAPSRLWLWILIGLVCGFFLLWFGNKAIVGFLGFNPIAAVGSFLSGMFSKAKRSEDTVKSVEKGLISKLLAKIMGR